ncbi:MAG: hypothetical protein IT572_04865 [Deltaproteobacteria bacterium]|nr:hypothetical protein [Deltaproteobacteria bacterium]
MTPPLLRSFGRPPGGELGTGGSRLDEIRISPELRRLSEVVGRSQDLASTRGRESLASITAACRGRTDCSPDLSLLPAAIDHAITRARGNPGYYRMALNFLAAQLMSTTDPAEQERIRTRAREVARDALTAISNPGFNPPPEDAERLDESVRTKTRMLFDISCTLSALLALPTREGYSEADRGLLRDYFHQMLSGMEQTRIRSAINPNSPPFPEYFEGFVRAQLAMLDNDREGAFRQLLATRALFRAMPADRRGRALPHLVETSTELALQSMPRDAAGEHVESLRSLISLEALSYFYQVDFSQSHAESELPTAQRQGAALNLVAGVYLGAGLEAADAGSLIERLAELGERRGDLTAALQRRYDADEEFRRGLSNLYSGNLGDASRRREVFEEMLRDAETVARHLRTHRDAEPYAAVLSRDAEGRPLRRAARALGSDAALAAELRTQLGLAEDASTESVARQLCEMGALLPVFLDSLPDLVRENPSHRSFFDAIRNAARGYREDGMRVNVEAPLVDLLEELHRRARDDDRYAPAYHAAFQSIGALERIAPDATLSPALRQSARRYAEELSSFSWRRVGRRLAAPESIGMLAAGVMLTELAPILLLRGAGTAGELGPLVRGGQVTGWGEFAVGAGVGLAMQAGGLTLHMAFNRAPGVGISQEFDRIGLGSLALGTVFSMLAMGGTVWGGRLLRRGLLPEGAALGPGRLALGHVGLRLGNWTIGGGLMLGAHSATAALTGHAAMPTGENVAEVFLTMALWDAAAAGLRFGLSRTRFWRHQIGPFRADQMVRSSVETMVRRAPELAGERNFLETYLQTQLRNPRRFQEIVRALERGEIPRLEGDGRARRLIFTAAPLSTEDPLSRTGAARAILQLDESGAERLRRILDSDAFAGHPEGIGPVRALIRQRLANGERRPRVWVRAYLEGDSISFEILQRQPADADRENTFTMDPNGIRNLQTDDPVLRAVIIGYQNQMFTPILPPSAGHSARPPARTGTTEEPTAAHRPPRPPAEPPAREPASTGGGEAEPVRSEPAAAEPPAEPVVAPISAPVESTPRTEPAAESAAETAPTRPAETGTARPVDSSDSAGTSESALEVTAPQQPTQALLEAARRPSTPEMPAVAEVPAAGGRPRRGDETIPFSTRQEQRARTASRPDIPIEQAQAVLQGEDPAATRRIPAEEARELRERLARLDDAEGARTESEAEPAARAAGESEAPMELQDGEFSLDAPSEAPPAEAPRAEAPPAEDPFSFADLNESGDAPAAGSEGVTLRPPRVPAEAAVQPPPIPARPRRGPPPLPKRTPPEALAEAIERESASAEPILLIRRRLEGLRPSPTRTAGVRIPVPEGYDTAAARMDRFFADLYAEVQDRGRQQAEYNTELAAEGLGPQELPYLNLFTVEVSPRGEMRIVSNVENLRYRDHSYFTLRRVTDDSRPDRFTFRIEEAMNMTDEMEAAGWREFLMRLFN